MTKGRKPWAPYNPPTKKSAEWAPGAFNLGGMSPQRTQMLGVAVLSAISIAGIHSAVCPSYFTMKTFASQPEAKDRAMEGLWISLGLSTVTAGSLYFVFKDWMPVLFAQATAILLFGIGVWAINSPPPVTIPPMELQKEALQSLTQPPQTVPVS